MVCACSMVVVAFLAGGCESDETASEPDNVAEEAVAGQKDVLVSWRDALGAELSSLTGKLGDVTTSLGPGCRPAKPLTPEHLSSDSYRQGLLYSLSCQFEKPMKNPEDELTDFDDVRFHENRVAVVRITLDDGSEMSSVPGSGLGLPEMPLRRSFRITASPGDEDVQRVEAYRVGERSEIVDGVIGYDVVSEPDDSDEVASVLIYGDVSEALVRHVRIQGPVFGDQDGVVVPESNAVKEDYGEAEQRVYVAINRRKQVSFGPMPAYPELPSDAPMASLETVTLSQDEVLGSSVSEKPWRDVYGLLENRRKKARQYLIDKLCKLVRSEPGESKDCGGGASADRVATVAVDALTPFGVLARVAEVMRRMQHKRLDVLTRENTEADRYRVARGAGLRTVELEAMPDRRPSMPYIGLQIHKDGIDVFFDGERMSAVEGCRGSGRTICVENREELADKFGKLKSLRDKSEVSPGNIEDPIEEVVRLYPSVKLYNAATRVVERAEQQELGHLQLVVSVEPEIPTGVATNLLDVVRYVRRPESSEASACGSQLSSESFDDIVICDSAYRGEGEYLFAEVHLKAFGTPWLPSGERPPAHERKTMELPEELSESKHVLGPVGLTASGQKTEDTPSASDAGQSTDDAGDANATEEQGNKTPDECMARVTSAEEDRKERRFFRALKPRPGQPTGNWKDVSSDESADLSNVECLSLEAVEQAALKIDEKLQHMHIQGLAVKGAWSVDGEPEEATDSTLYLRGMESGVAWIRPIGADGVYRDVPVVVSP